MTRNGPVIDFERGELAAIRDYWLALRLPCARCGLPIDYDPSSVDAARATSASPVLVFPLTHGRCRLPVGPESDVDGRRARTRSEEAATLIADEHIDAIDEIRLPRNRDELPGPPAEPTLHTTPDPDGPKHLSWEQRKQEDTSVRSSSDGCAKVKA
jgi:hypothetical protein